MNTKFFAAAVLTIAANISAAGTTSMSASGNHAELRVLAAASVSQTAANATPASALVQVTMALDDAVLATYPELSDLKAVANYSVNCKNNTIAIANFEVSRGAANATATTAVESASAMEFAAVRFYSDYAILQAACTSNVAMLKQ